VLHRHGHFNRSFTDQQDVTREIPIQRLRCSACRVTFSLLPDFLIPYHRYTASAFQKAVVTYLRHLSTYSDALWGSNDCEQNMVISTFFRLVASMTFNAWLALQQVLAQLVPRGEALSATTVNCPNAPSARIPGKGQRLSALANVLHLTGIAADSCIFEKLQGLFANAPEYSFHLLSSRKNLRLSAPHYTQLALL
jgi:uncharacterized protein DUF6431